MITHGHNGPLFTNNDKVNQHEIYGTVKWLQPYKSMGCGKSYIPQNL